ncbi:MAG: DUF349 domain-containing protein [Crocinitomicaceae bacterium]|nr:DUF349 domain-containing protein [Flavobacteriales bacterium]NQZ35864.1 DUF349 domain-containing protein [Crocinitomicaceae bacterium]
MDFIAKLEELSGHEDVLTVSREVNELRGKFDDYVLEEERKLQVSQLEEEKVEVEVEGIEGEAGEDAQPQDIPKIAEPETDFGKEAFYTLFDAFKVRRKEAVDAKNAILTENLRQKKELIARLQKVVTSEENIGAAFAAFKEIQEKWTEIGDIPRDDRADIQKDYSKLLEDFFYNINIYKQLKDHDFHRNHQKKIELIEELKALQKEESLKEAETGLKRIQNEWDEIGPVPNEEWEKVKEAYWTEVRSLYNRINRHYEDRREEQRVNMEQKQVLIAEVKVHTQELETLTDRKVWEDRTAEILAVQKAWKGVGAGPRKENEIIWKEFRKECDVFFDAKKAFYDTLNSEFDGVAAKKQVLIDRANALKTSTNWKETANQLVQLQKEWKTLGHAGRRNEQKLWKNFRSACDGFFNAREQHFAAQDEELAGNLTLKNALLEKLVAYNVPEEKSTALAELKTFSADFNAIGKVPMKAKDATYKAFKSAMDEHYGKLKMEGAEKDKIMFEAKLETLKASPNSSRLLSDMKLDLRKEIDKLQKEIHLLENNLGFFANSKGADALKKDVEKKVQRVQDKVLSLRAKMKLIPNE